MDRDAARAIEEALDLRGCLSCGAERLEAVLLLERRGIAPHLEGHVIAYDHYALVRCAACGGGHLDRRLKDSSDWEDAFEQGTAFRIADEGMALLAEAVKRCPEPLSENCRCAVHASLNRSRQALPPDPDGQFQHVPRLTIELAKKGPRFLALSGAFESRYPDGKPRSCVTLKDGRLEGRCTLWRENGFKRSEGGMRGGAREGRWQEWDAQGNLYLEQDWKDGCVVAQA